jgi:hypothetical protein
LNPTATKFVPTGPVVAELSVGAAVAPDITIRLK